MCGPEGPIIHVGACVGEFVGGVIPNVGRDGLTRRNLVALGGETVFFVLEGRGNFLLSRRLFNTRLASLDTRFSRGWSFRCLPRAHSRSNSRYRGTSLLLR